MDPRRGRRIRKGYLCRSSLVARQLRAGQKIKLREKPFLGPTAKK